MLIESDTMLRALHFIAAQRSTCTYYVASISGAGVFLGGVLSLTLGAHAPEGYGSCVSVCLCLCVCVSVCLLLN